MLKARRGAYINPDQSADERLYTTKYLEKKSRLFQLEMIQVFLSANYIQLSSSPMTFMAADVGKTVSKENPSSRRQEDTVKKIGELGAHIPLYCDHFRH